MPPMLCKLRCLLQPMFVSCRTDHRGGDRARSLYATPPPPAPPPGFERYWAGHMAPTAPPFFPHGANGAPFSSVSAKFRKTRRYTNVVCCEVLSVRIGKTGCYTNGLLPPEDPAFGAKPRPECSANFFLGRTHSFNLSFSFPRFVAWPLELGLGTHNPRFGVAPRVGVRDSQSTFRCGTSSWGWGPAIHALLRGPSSWG